MLDATPLGKLGHWKPKPDIYLWYASLITAGWEIIIPEICDFEVRRNLILEGAFNSIKRLDELKAVLV